MQTELDRISNQNHLQLIKALIPHLPASNRKRFSVLIKIIEVQNVIRFYNNPDTDIRADRVFTEDMAGKKSRGVSGSGAHPDGTACEPPPKPSDPPEPPDLLDILADVRCYCEGEEQQMIDQTLQMLSMVELFSVMAQEDASSDGGKDCHSDERFCENDTSDLNTPPSECGSC